jgi:exopolysaccharide/PEP-CTERM locus tyrosine autokinase
MSLVERAIARLRLANDGKPVTVPTLPVNDAQPSAAPPAAPTPARYLDIDSGALRASGYMPESARERLFAEQYRQVKRPVIDKALAAPSGSLRDSRFVMVTSALPGDGKTFTTINLALSIARERDVSVLLIDADTPKQHISDIFGLRGIPGLTDALIDEKLDVESLVLGTNIRGLSILPSGLFVEGAAELLSSARMRQLIANLTARSPRRILLVDSPPLLITSEGRALLKIAGQALLVVRASHTPRRAVEEAVALFAGDQAGGIVLNQANMGITEGYYGYGGYGSYGVSVDESTPKA